MVPDVDDGGETSSVPYHLNELRIVQNEDDPRRVLPSAQKPGSSVLDIGCGIGQALAAPEFSKCSTRCGIDIDASAIAYGQKAFPFLGLSVAQGESIPFRDSSFDLVFSRVALPYCNIAVALSEMHRVLKPGGRLWVSLHAWEMEKEQLLSALRSMHPIRIVDRMYVILNGVIFARTGHCYPRPWNGRIESFQTVRGFECALVKAGFQEASTQVRGRNFIVEASRPAL